MHPKDDYNLAKVLLKNSLKHNHRSVFVVLGAEAVKEIPVFYHLLARKKVNDISVLCCSNDSPDLRNIDWCLKDDRDVSTSKPQEDILSSIHHISYKDIQHNLYQSYNLVVLQNFENVNLSTLASITESVKGGGALILLFSKIQNTTQFTLEEISNVIQSKFMKRLCVSLMACPNCLIMDDQMNILAKNTSNIKDVTSKVASDSEDLQKLKAENTSDSVTHALVNLCQTVDQAKLLLKFIDALRKRTFHSTISVSSPKGRGKSAALGLAIAGSLSLNYSNIFISSSNYENVKIVFKFLFKGLDALNYKEDEDYDLIQSVNPKFNNALIGVNIFKDHPQAVRFIFPGDVENKLEQAELVVIDEAASISLPLLKRLIGSYVVFMASTTTGCGGAGKYLYESVVREIRQPAALKGDGKVISPATLYSGTDGSFEKFTLSEPIFYSSGDEVENWINQLLCLENSISANLSHGCPEPQQCRLFYVCPETLFSYENHAEKFLQQLMSLFLSSKRNISPDFISKVADDNDYHIFCLLSPFNNTLKVAPEILCAILVHAENQIPCNFVYSAINQPEHSNCFNIWKNVSEEFQDFLPKKGIHIIDIVTHPEYKRMGYGLRTLQLLQEFYEGKWISLEDNPFIYSRQNANNFKKESQPPLLLQLTEVETEKIEYFMVSYFLTPELLKFWKKGSFVPLFISRQKNLDQEHLCFMMKSIDKDFDAYLEESWRCFCEHVFLLLSAELKSLPSSFALNLLKSNISNQLPLKALTKEDIDIYLKPQRMKSLEKYCQNLGDLHCIMPCIPVLTKLFFRNCFIGITLPVVQEVILLSFGLQHNTIDDISKDLGLPSTQIHGLLNRTVRKLTNYLSSIIERTVEKTIKAPSVKMEPLAQTIDEELEEAAQKIKLQQEEETKKLKDMDFSQYAIKGSEDDWEKALHSGRKTLVSIKSLKKAPEDVEFPRPSKNISFKSKHKSAKKKR